MALEPPGRGFRAQEVIRISHATPDGDRRRTGGRAPDLCLHSPASVHLPRPSMGEVAAHFPDVRYRERSTPAMVERHTAQHLRVRDTDPAPHRHALRGIDSMCRSQSVMKLRLLNLLACPTCGGELKLRDAEQDPACPEESRTGELFCVSCEARFPVSGGIPRWLPPSCSPGAEWRPRALGSRWPA